MPTMDEFKEAFESSYDDVRLNAANYLFKLHEVNYSFGPNMLQWVISKLNDDSELVRQRVAQFLYLRVNSGHDLGYFWLNLAKYLKSEDPLVRKTIIATFGKLGQGESLLKKALNDSRLSPEQRFEISEALGHYYSNAKYLSSLNDNLKSDKPEIIKGALNAVRINQSLGILKSQDISNLKQSIQSAYTNLNKPKARELPKVKEPRDLQREMKDRNRYARA